MARTPDGYAKQAKRYLIDPTNGIDQALARFREDLETQTNVAAPIAGLYLAGAFSVARLRTAPLEDIHDQDLTYARTVQGVLNSAFVGLSFEATRTRRPQGHMPPWVGSVVLRSSIFAEGYGYPEEVTFPTSADALQFATSEGGEMFADCADLSRSPDAPVYTGLRIPPSRRSEVLSRYAVADVPLPPTRPQAL
ncbi:MAG TPA: hypothetical protein VLF62_02905 [Candidatus Saccharimonadales bacterium]|nr:hypothetical protein [Candidatus Saccharimonadales bacterium]